MSDFADLASAQEQLDRDTALAARTMFGGQSLATCEDCGNPIPLKRQHAIAGAADLVACAYVGSHQLCQLAAAHHPSGVHAVQLRYAE